MNYRKIWETHNNKKIPDNYEIHHIDGNRNNNSPENLLCVSIEEHLKIHKSQHDWGAVQAILMRMNYDKEELSENSSKHQKQLIEENRHNFQKISKEERKEISKKVHKNRKTAFLGIENIVENSRNAGKMAAIKKAGFLDIKSDKHGSKYVKDTYWWVNPQNKRIRAVECPGKQWKKGMKYHDS